MKKYYAREIRSDYFEYEYYYNQDDAEEMNVWIGGNRDCDCSEMNGDFKNSIADKLNAITEDIDYNVPDDSTTEEQFRISREIVENYISKANGEALTDTEVKAIIIAADDYTTCHSNYDALEYITDVLAIINGEKYDYGYIRGCVQRDWQMYIMPAKYADRLEYIEAVYFGTGVELKVTDEMYDHCPDMDAVETHYIYTAEYNPEAIKQEIANGEGVLIEEVCLLKVKRKWIETHYEYEET